MNFETDCQGPPRQSDWPPQFPWPLAGDPGTTRRRPARKRYSQVDGSPSGEWFRGGITMIDSHGAGRATEPAGSPEGYERRRLAAIPGSPRGSSGESQIEPVSLKARAGTSPRAPN